MSPLDVGDATYLQAAANWASRAHSSEAQGDFLGAFTHYKAAVGALLEGVQGKCAAPGLPWVCTEFALGLPRGHSGVARGTLCLP